MSRIFLLIEALTSTALSHDEHCECDVCEAAAGDEDAFLRFVARVSSGEGG